MHRRIICIALLLILMLPACGEELLESWDTVRKIKTKDDRYLISLDEKWGLADGESNVIVQPQYDDIGDPGPEAITVCLDGKWGLIDYDGKILLEPRLRHEPVYSGDYAVASVSDQNHWEDFSGVIEYLPLYGVVDRKGNVVIPFEYDEIEFTPDGQLLRVETGDRCGYMSLDGEWVIEPKYASIGLFEGNYIEATLAAENPDKANESFDYTPADGVIDREGNIIIPFEYDTLYVEENGLIRARRGEEWGYINLENETVIDLKYAALYSFTNGYAPAAISIPLPPGTQDSLDYTLAWGLLDESGKTVLPFDYSSIEFSPDGDSVAAVLDGEYHYFRITDAGLEETLQE